MSLPVWAQRLPMDLIKDASHEFSLDYRLISAICQQESAGRAWITRFEPATKNSITSDYAQIASKLSITPPTEQVQQMTSWGLMQVMGYTARNLGYEDYLTRLCEPEYSIHYGCLLLGQLFKRFVDLQSVISAYNAGSVRLGSDGKLVNYANYVMPVLTYMSALNDS